jgi:hypothetical protein
LEYSFLTTEIPDSVGESGWFGTQFNDLFEVSITADAGNLPIGIEEYVSAANSMNGLGLGAFHVLDHPGYSETCCYKLNLDVNQRNAGKAITFGITVANAVDGLFDSAVCGRVFFDIC